MLVRMYSKTWRRYQSVIHLIEERLLFVVLLLWLGLVEFRRVSRVNKVMAEPRISNRGITRIIYP